MDDNPRQLALGLAKFIVENPNRELSGDQIGAIVYRLRVVDVYGGSDVNLVCEALKNIIHRLVNLPTLVFCSDIWLLITIAIIEGSIELEWKTMVEEINVIELAEPYLDQVGEIESSRQILKTSEQINKNLEVAVLESGLIERVFESFWETKFDTLLQRVFDENWEQIDIQSNECSTSQAIRLVDMKIFESFKNMKDHAELAKKLYFAAMTRVIIRVSQIEDLGDDSDCISAFLVFNKIVSKVWSDLCDDVEVLKYSLVAFDKLLNVSLPCGCVLRSMESIEEACGWLKIPSLEVCQAIDDTMWSCYYSLTFKLFEFKTNTPFDMNFESDNWLETMCEKIPAMLDEQTKEERNVRDKIQRTRAALNFILDVLIKSTSRDEAMNMMRTTYSVLISSREPETAARVKNVYKSFVDREIISEADQLKLAQDVIKNDALQEIKAIVLCMPGESSVREEAAKIYFERIVGEVIHESHQPDVIKGKLMIAEECIGILVRYLSQKDTIFFVKLLLDVIQTEKTQHIEFAMTLFSRIVESCTPSEFAHRDKIGWFLDFKSLDISHENWNDVLTKIGKFNKKEVEKRFISGLTVLSMRQMTSETLELDELMYVLRRLGHQRTELGRNCTKKFYNDCPEVMKALEKFTSQEHALLLSIRLTKLLSENVMNGGRQWQDHAHSLELVLPFIVEFEISTDRQMISSLISLSSSLAAYEFFRMANMGVPIESINQEEAYCLSRIWKCSFFDTLTTSENEALNNLLNVKLKENSGRNPSGDPNSRRSTLRPKSVPKRTRQEIQLISLFNDICMHLLYCSEMLNDSTTRDEKDEELFGWLIGVSYGTGDGLFTKEVISEAKKIVMTNFGEKEMLTLQRIYVMHFLMMGSTIRSDSESLNEYFTTIYIFLLRNFLQNDVQEDDNIDKYMGNLKYWMIECANTTKRTSTFTKSFMRKFGKLLAKSKSFKVSTVHDKTLKSLFESVDKLPGWLENSKCPITLFSSMQPILSSYLHNSDAYVEYEPKIQTALLKAIDIVLADNAVESLMTEQNYIVQMSESRLASMLNIKAENDDNEDEKVHQSVKNALKIFSFCGGYDVQKKIVERITELIPILMKDIARKETVLSGKTWKTNDTKILAFNVMLITELMDYINSLINSIIDEKPENEDNFEKVFMLNDDDIENRHRKSEKSEKRKKAEESETEKEWKECSFKTSGKLFILQHWYNCYTCDMTDTRGICSVCAVNCHRGHDLAYSKKGSFFCDCGDGNCSSLQNPKYLPNVSNAIRGQCSGSSENWEKNGPTNQFSSFDFRSIQFEKDETSNIKKSLENLRETVDKCQNDVERILCAVRDGNENSLKVAERRENILKSIDNLPKMDIVTDVVIMEELSEFVDDRSCFLPTRIRDANGERTNGQMTNIGKCRDLANVMKLDDGTEVWIVISESSQATLNLFYSDTRISFSGGFSNVRQEIEQLPFVGRSLTVSGNRVAVWGIADVFAMRFSPSGDVIDRAHIRLTEMATVTNTYNNPVVKAIWSHERDKQILAIATVQSVRVYDLTLDLGKCIEEMVLPVGNVEDIAMISLPDKLGVKILVLGTTGYLYENDITSKIADNNSIFLTNCLNSPVTSQSTAAGSGVSMHYSTTYNLLFASFESGTFCARVPNRLLPPNTRPTDENSLTWKRLNFNNPVVCWKEKAGIISCLSASQSTIIFYVHVNVENFMIQKVTSTRSIMAQFLSISPKNDGIYSFVLYNDQPTVQVFKTAWKQVFDLWIDDIPSEQVLLKPDTSSTKPIILPNEDLVVLNEGCEVIENIDWLSDDLLRIYDNADLKLRLSSDTQQPFRVVKMSKCRISGRLANSRMVVRGIRIETNAHGPAAVIVQGIRFETATNIPRVFDLRFTRQQSLDIDHREFQIIFEAREDQQISINSFKLFGCDRDLMEEYQPMYQCQPVLNLPNRLVTSFFEMSYNLLSFQKENEDNGWLNNTCSKYLSRRVNHPDVCTITTKILKRLNRLDMFEIIDASFIEEWKELAKWKEEDGMIEIRRKYVEKLIKRLEAVSTRWTIFENLLRKAFPDILDFFRLMRTEMLRMPLSKCQNMAQGMVRLIFGFLAEYCPETDLLIQFFLNLFTDSETCHLTNDIRSAVQVAMYSLGGVGRDDRDLCRKMIEENTKELYWKMRVYGSSPFYGRTKIHLLSEGLDDLRKLSGSLDPAKHLEKLSVDQEFDWLDELLKSTIDKLYNEASVNSMPNHLTQMIDTPSYGLTMVAIVVFGQYYTNRVRQSIEYLLGLLNFKSSNILPLNEESFRNFSLFRLLENLLSRYISHDGKKEEGEVGIEEKKKRTVQLLSDTSSTLIEAKVLEMCYEILEVAAVYWKKTFKLSRSRSTPAQSSAELPHTRRVWLPHVPLVASSAANPPNSRAHVEHGPRNEEEVYMTNVTDLALRIPILLHRIEVVPFEEKWYRRLCEIVSIQDAPSYRNSKKLLIAMSGGDKLKYRAIRDKFKLQEYLDSVRAKYANARKKCGGHQQLTEIVDVLRSLGTLAMTRKEMWKEICETHILWLLKLACTAADVISLLILDLIIIAVRDSSTNCVQLADQIIEAESGELLNRIIDRFLYAREEQQRWLVHGLLRSIIQLGSRQNQVSLVRRLYAEMYPKAKNRGCHASQLTDLVSTYAPRCFNTGELLQMCDAEIAGVQEISKMFDSLGISGSYKQMMDLGVGWQAILFSQTPCLVCFNRKNGNELLKLSTIKRDSRYSANAMVHKLSTNYEVSKIILKLSDVKKMKTIKRVTAYYCPRAVESVVELKLNPEEWRKCAYTTVSSNDTQINLNLAVPVITSSLIIEFTELNEVHTNNQIQCPRCSILVRSHSGVCENCGENANQCIKCRAINYVEREPFLCQTCGFCKYARIDVMITGRKLPGTQHITCDSEKAQCIEEMSKLLIRQDTRRSEFAAIRALCDSMMFSGRPLAPFILHAENNQIRDTFRTAMHIDLPYTAFNAPVHMLQKVTNLMNACHDDMCQDTEQLMSLRDELTRYDESNKTPIVFYKPKKYDYSASGHCFGCLCSRIFHAIALLHAACEDEDVKYQLISMSGLYETIAKLSMTFEPLREECESLFVRLTLDNEDATRKMEKMINSGRADIQIFVRSLMTVTDSTWQQKLKFMVRYSMEKNDENIKLQTLMILNKYMEIARPIRFTVYRKMAKRRNESYPHNGKQYPPTMNRVKVDNYRIPPRTAVARWLTTPDEWSACCYDVPSTSKYIHKPDFTKYDTAQYQWMCSCLFSEWSTIRAASNRLLVNLSRQPGHEGVAILMMIEWLEKMPDISIHLCDQFIHSAHAIVGASANIKTRLFVEKFHVWLIRQIHAQCARIDQKGSDDLIKDMSFGLRLRCYVELLCLMFSGSSVENVLLKAGADDLLVFLLQSTIFLKRLVIRRTRPIDSSRTALEKLLRRVSNKDGAKMMKACVETLKMLKDINTLGHLVSVILEIMDPQKEAEEEFLIEIEKDAAQDDFLQGRMSGNPYKCNDNGMGPLMRDIKNKICRDTEMIALLEDDNGMELLVSNNIISLSLSVREVYEKLWKRNNPDTNVMNVVYRMRGLMGDATETFISSFGDVDGESGAGEDETLAKITKILIDCDGIDRLLQLLQIGNLNSSGRFLLGQLRRLFERIVRTSIGRQSLVKLRTIPILIKVIRKCYEGCSMNYDESRMTLGMEFYKVAEIMVTDVEIHKNLSGIDKADAEWLIEMYRVRNDDGTRVAIINETSRKVLQVLEFMSLNLANVLLGSEESENVLIGRYKKVYDWQYVDRIEVVSEREDVMWMAEQFSRAISNVIKSERGNMFKQNVVDSGLVEDTCSYLTNHHPPLYSPTESQEWKSFLVKPSLKLMLNLLHALARNHQSAQKAIAATTLPLLHRLEQVASENSIGIMAENVMDALKEDAEVADKIVAVRAETRQKKRQLAMAMRNKQLSKMGMQMGKGGEVKVSSRKITNEPTLDDTTDPFVCCICREAALSGPKQSVVYSFAYQSSGSVSLMVLVHLECHNGAIRRGGGGNARSVDEWNKAMLHNAGVKCNILTPIAMGNAPVDVFQAAIQRYQTDYEHIGNHNGPITRQFIFKDMCQIVRKFIFKESFSTQSQGGGRESNTQYFAILYLLALSLPVDELNDLQTSEPRDRLVSFLLTEPKLENWQESKKDILRASLNDARMSNVEMTWQGGARYVLLTWAFVDAYFNKIVPTNDDDRINWMRQNLREMLTKTSKFVQDFDDDLMKCESVEEFCDITSVSIEEMTEMLDSERNVVPEEDV